MKEVTLKDVLDVVVDMKLDIKELKQDMNEMKQGQERMEETQQIMQEDTKRNFEEIKQTQKQILQLQEDVTVKIKWVVKRIGEDEVRIEKLEKDRNNFTRKRRGKIIEYKGKMK